MYVGCCIDHKVGYRLLRQFVHSKKEVSLPQAKDCLKLVPMEDIYPLFPSDFTLAPSISQPATAKVLQAGKEAVSNPLSQYHLGAGYALNWCEAAHYIGRESVSG